MTTPWLTRGRGPSRDDRLDAAANWDAARAAVFAISLARPEDGTGLDRPALEAVVATALALTIHAEQVGHARPDGVYPLPDGNIMFEWHWPEGVREYWEVEGPGQVQVMTAYSDGRPTTFRDYVGLTRIAADGFAHPSRPVPDDLSGLDEYQLAA